LIEPSASLRWRCAVCGGGRIPGLHAAALGAASVAKLVAARRGRAVEVAAGIGALVFASSAVFLGLIAAFALHHAAGIAGATLLVVGGVLAVVAIALLRARSRNGAAWRVALDDAWTDAAEKIARASGEPMTNARLAEAMQVSEEVAEQVLGQLSLEGARVSVGDDAVLHYRVSPKIEVKPDADAEATEGESIEPSETNKERR
jgi:hypothetical protein